MRPLAFTLSVLVTIGALGGAVHADGALSAEKPDQTPCSAPEFRQWDFWLGTWRVTDPKGIFQGSNVISRAPSGCGLIENWHSAGGGRGISLNGYDSVRKTWTQLWISPDSVIRLEGKLNERGALPMEGTISYNDKPIEHPFRGTWTPLSDGSVKQEFYEFDPATGKWEEWFIGIYRRADAPLSK